MNPYPHVFIEEIIHPELYECLLSNIRGLGIDEYHQLKANPERYVVTLKSADGLLPDINKTSGGGKVEPEFWRGFAGMLGGPETMSAYLRKFLATVRMRQVAGFADDLEFSALQQGLYWKMELDRDISGYEIGPHTDAHRKWVTALYYTPRDLDHVDVAGTAIVRSRSERIQLGDSRWESWSDPDFEVAFQAPYTRNSVLAFAPCYGSWHAVPKMDAFVRDTIQTFIMSKGKSKKTHCPRNVLK